MHPVHERHTENHGEEVHCDCADILDVRVSCEQKTVARGLLPQVERGVADAELQTVTHVLDSDPVFGCGENNVRKQAEQGDNARNHGVGALPVFDADHERRR